MTCNFGEYLMESHQFYIISSGLFSTKSICNNDETPWLLECFKTWFQWQESKAKWTITGISWLEFIFNKKKPIKLFWTIRLNVLSRFSCKDFAYLFQVKVLLTKEKRRFNMNILRWWRKKSDRRKNQHHSYHMMWKRRKNL